MLLTAAHGALRLSLLRHIDHTSTLDVPLLADACAAAPTRPRAAFRCPAALADSLASAPPPRPTTPGCTHTNISKRLAWSVRCCALCTRAGADHRWSSDCHQTSSVLYFELTIVLCCHSALKAPLQSCSAHKSALHARASCWAAAAASAHPVWLHCSLAGLAALARPAGGLQGRRRVQVYRDTRLRFHSALRKAAPH